MADDLEQRASSGNEALNCTVEPRHLQTAAIRLQITMDNTEYELGQPASTDSRVVVCRVSYIVMFDYYTTLIVYMGGQLDELLASLASVVALFAYYLHFIVFWLMHGDKYI